MNTEKKYDEMATNYLMFELFSIKIPFSVKILFYSGKRRWLPTGASAAPSGPGSFPPGAPSKPDDSSRVASSTTSPSEGNSKVWRMC